LNAVYDYNTHIDIACFVSRKPDCQVQWYEGIAITLVSYHIYVTTNIVVIIYRHT